MSQKQEHEHVTEIKDGTIVLTTKYETGLMGHLAGIVFTADIAVGRKQAKTSFLVREKDIRTVTSFDDTQNFCMIGQMSGGPHDWN